MQIIFNNLGMNDIGAAVGGIAEALDSNQSLRILNLC
jgi:hypothetical protein